MQKQEMVAQLQQNAENLKQELMQLQETFNTKKEQYVKIEGALEALSLLEDTSQEAQTEE
jgi:hypothetical protein